MTEGALVERLDQTVDAILTSGDATPALADQELAPLARVAAILRHYPNTAFKARLRAGLAFTTITPFIRVSESGLVDFLAGVFGAVETNRMSVSAGGVRRDVRVGNSMLLIEEAGAGDVVPLMPVEFHVYVEDVDAAFQRALAAGATSLGGPAERPYGERAGFVRDRFGNHWFIATYSGTSYIPEGLRTVTPFVHVKATSRYIEFLKQAFEAVEEGRHEIGGVVRYARLRIGNAAIELGEAESAAESMPGTFYLLARDADVMYQRAVAAGARPLSPAMSGQQHWDPVGSVEDATGNQWFIARRV